MVLGGSSCFCLFVFLGRSCWFLRIPNESCWLLAVLCGSVWFVVFLVVMGGLYVFFCGFWRFLVVHEVF